MKLNPFLIIVDPNDGDITVLLYKALLNRPDITRVIIYGDHCQIWFRNKDSTFPMTSEQINWKSGHKRSYSAKNDNLIDYRFDECLEAWIADTQKGENTKEFGLIFNPYKNVFLASREAIKHRAVEPVMFTEPSEADRETKLDLFDLNRYNRKGETFMVARGLHPNDIELYWEWYLGFVESAPY